MKKYLSILFILFCNSVFAQTTIWSETFDPAPLPGWNLNVSTGTNDADANLWTITDAEGGVLPPNCGVAFNGNNTLHITPNNLGFGTGALYNAGGLCPFLCVTTNKRCETPNINTTGYTNLTLNFDFITGGDGTFDNFTIQYSSNGGATWFSSSAPPNSPLPASCGGQAEWANYSVGLSPALNNIPNLKIAFVWTNNDDGIGTDPSVAVNNITVVAANATNNAPTAFNDTLNIPCNSTSVLVNPLVNDIDINAGQLLSLSTTPIAVVGGSANNFSSTSFNFTAATNFSGPAYVDYQVCDNGTPSLCDTARVYFNIAPCNQYPIAQNNSYTVCFNATHTLSVMANDSDPDGNPLSLNSILIGNSPALFSNNGSAIIVTPTPNYTGNFSFDYIICDNGSPSLCDTATVFVTVIPCNIPPIAATDNYTVPCIGTNNFAVLANDVDPDGNTFTLAAIIKNGSIGNAVLNNNVITYTTPPLNCKSGIDTVLYSICDTGNPIGCDTGMILINVQICAVSCNANPIANTDNYTATCATGTTILTQPLNNDTDPDLGQILTITNLIGNGTLGTFSLVNNTVTYTLNFCASGVDSIRYEVADNGTPILKDTGWIVVTINAPCNCNPPIAVIDTLTIACNSTATINPIVNDVDPDGGVVFLNTPIVKNPTNGTITQSGNILTYTPTLCFIGNDTVLYRVSDLAPPSFSDTGMIVFTVAAGCPCNPPIANPDTASTLCNTNVTIAPLLNDLDIDGGALALANATIFGPNHGSVVKNGNTYIYSPANCYSGRDTILYRVCDNTNLCDTGVVIITVGICNCPPPTAEFGATPLEVCAGDCVQFTDLSTENPTSWQWTFQGGTPSSSTVKNPGPICYDIPGVYDVTLIASNAQGSSAPLTKTNYIAVKPVSQNLNYTINDTIGELISFNAVNTGKSYIWTPSSGLSTNNTFATSAIVIDSFKQYICTITTIHNCTSTTTYSIYGFPSFANTPKKNTIWVPNVFTPNGDFKNDFWAPIAFNVKEYSCTIYDRWGKKVFTSKDPNQRWNGTTNGIDIGGNQVFYYYIKAIFNDGEVKELKGDLMVVF